MSLYFVGKLTKQPGSDLIKLGFDELRECSYTVCSDAHVFVTLGIYGNVLYSIIGKVVVTLPNDINQLKDANVYTYESLGDNVFIPLTVSGVVGNSYLLLTKDNARVYMWSKVTLEGSILSKFLRRLKLCTLLEEISFVGTCEGLRLILVNKSLTLNHKLVAAKLLASIGVVGDICDDTESISDYTVCVSLLAHIVRDLSLDTSDKDTLVTARLALGHVPVMAIESDSRLFNLYNTLHRITQATSSDIRSPIYHNLLYDHAREYA